MRDNNPWHSRRITRRHFLRKSLTTTTALAAAGTYSAQASIPDLIKIEEPFHGAILNRRHGDLVENGLKINVTGEAPLGEKVTVNGKIAERTGRKFLAELTIRDKVTEIVAIGKGSFGSHEHRIKIVRDKFSFPRYRFGIDDNSFFLRDIAQKNYKSIFDCFYLKILQDLHRKYGTLFVLNIYYTTADGFDLTQFPARYKREWLDNADWLKLSFHAYANDPDRPYQYAPTEKLLSDFDKVVEQIHRFAGEKVYSPPTVLHWAMARPESLKPLYERGVRVLSGAFVFRYGGWDGNYFLDDARSEYIANNDVLMDFDSGIIFSIADIVCNKTPADKVAAKLQSIAENPNRAEIMDLFTHEQYFWPFYSHYIPDHAQRLDAAIKWVTEHGYKPVFFHEGLLGGPV